MKSTYKAVEVSAPDLAKLAIEAHGGLDRWKRFTTLSVHGINAGVLWGAKGKAGVRSPLPIVWPIASRNLGRRCEYEQTTEPTNGKESS